MSAPVEAVVIQLRGDHRLLATEDALVGAYLRRLAGQVLDEVDTQAERARTDREPARALHEVLAAVAADLARPGFRGCASNNASIEYDDPAHPARVAARDYRAALHQRLHRLTDEVLPAEPEQAAMLAGRLAALIDGACTSAAHLGPDGPATAGLALAHALVDQAERTGERMRTTA